MPSLSQPTRVLLGRGVLVNLFASRRLTRVLSSLQTSPAVARAACDGGAVWVGSGPRDDPAADYELVDLPQAVGAGVLEIATPESDAEYETFFALAPRLGDAEAMSCAIAMHRGFMFATDDPATTEVVSALPHEFALLTTPAILRAWADISAITTRELSDVLQLVEQRARFRPSRSDPLGKWWWTLARRKA